MLLHEIARMFSDIVFYLLHLVISVYHLKFYVRVRLGKSIYSLQRDCLNNASSP